MAKRNPVADQIADLRYIRFECALVWILTRDFKCVTDCEGARSKGAIFAKRTIFRLDDGAEALKEASWSWKEAWLLLQKAVGDGKVKLKGIPYREATPGPNASAPLARATSSVESSDQADAKENAAKAMLQKTEIVDHETMELVLDVKEQVHFMPVWRIIEDRSYPAYQLHGEQHFYLRPQTWALTGGQGWEEVEVSETGLIAAFPTNDTTPRSIITNPRNLPRHPVQLAFLKHYPHGVRPGLAVTGRDKTINDECEKEYGRIYTPQTIRRQLRLLGVLKRKDK
jgi:hypothetical protein